jgi:hypothetical protein
MIEDIEPGYKESKTFFAWPQFGEKALPHIDLDYPPFLYNEPAFDGTVPAMQRQLSL